MIMPIIVFLRKKKMDFVRLILNGICSLLFVFSMTTGISLGAEFLPVKSVNLKTRKVDISTEFGPLLTEIHFDESNDSLALRVEEIIRRDLIRAVNYFQFTPKEIIHFNIDPYILLNNGFATVFPQSIIHLFNHPPVQRDHLIVMEDWLRGLVFHEFIHIVHLTQVRDYLKIGQNIFGTVAKLPAGIVPRWFTEGIAVWAESSLLGKGRLQNISFRNELKAYLKNNSTCHTIDCLDDPLEYPGGQLAYWAGGFFIEFLEKQKSGTVKCLVEYNSSNIPFFLNNAFSECAGEKAQSLFSKFHQTFLGTDSPGEITSEQLKEVPHSYGENNIQKGVVLHNRTIFKIEKRNRVEVLSGYRLGEKNSSVERLPHFPKFYSAPFASLSGVVESTFPGAGNGEKKQFLLASFFADPDFRRENRLWRLLSIDNSASHGDIELNCQSNPLYVVPGPHSGEYITASFQHGVWNIIKEQCQGDAGQLLFSLNQKVNLMHFEKREKLIIYQVEEAGAHRVYVADSDFKKQFMAFERKINSNNEVSTSIDLPVIGNQHLVVRENGNLELIEWSADLKVVTKASLKKPVGPLSNLQDVSFVLANGDDVIQVSDSISLLSQSSKDYFAFLSSLKNGNVETKALQEMTSGPLKTKQMEPGQNKNLSDSKLENYPAWSHLTPHWWFFTSGTGENINSLGAMTSVADPMQVHSADLSLVFYEKMKLGGDLNYQQKVVSVSDLWGINAFFRKEYYKSDLSAIINKSQDDVLGTQYLFLLRKWTLAPGLFVAYKKNEDFISKRSIYSIGTGVDLFYNAQSFNDIFQELVFRSKFQIDDSSLGKNFLNMQLTLDLEARVYEDLDIGMSASYGKLVKSGFVDGVIYGGGDQRQINRWYNFYGIPYSNIYGNEIFVFKSLIDFNALNVYRGYGFVPFYFKELRFLVGNEILKADRIYLDRTLLVNKTLHGIYAGPRFKLNLFYYVPAEIDFIFSSIKHPNGKNIRSASLVINADLF